MLPGFRHFIDYKELYRRAESLYLIYTACKLCPHQCGVNRTKGELGRCRSGALPAVASYNVHRGEEPPISGVNGSGTIFFSGCTGQCLFCQNYPISQLGAGCEVSEYRLAEMMLELQDRKCHNINLVTPTHFIPSIVSAIIRASERGLTIPIVYNTSGYERPEIVAMLENIVDVYLPDAKYADDITAYEISGFHNYVLHNRLSICEMYRQTGNLTMEDGIAIKGILVRHLILPENVSGSKEIFHFLAREISPDIHVSLMDQYFPAYKALTHKKLSRKITIEEYTEAIDLFYESGLNNGWIQEHIGEC